jgi:opine dehydrogenase
MGGKFYQDSTIPGIRLVEGFDAERRRLSEHLGSIWFESQHDFDERAYGYQIDDLAAALRGSPHSDWYASADYLEQVSSEDVIYSYVPMVLLGTALGVDLPLTRGMIDVYGTMLGREFWSEGIDLEALGLQGLDTAGVRDFVMTGRK